VMEYLLDFRPTITMSDTSRKRMSTACAYNEYAVFSYNNSNTIAIIVLL